MLELLRSRAMDSREWGQWVGEYPVPPGEAEHTTDPRNLRKLSGKWLYEYGTRPRSKEGEPHNRQNRYLCRARRARLNSRILCPYLHAQSPTANPTGIEGSRMDITPKPSPVKLVGKRTSTVTVSAAGSGTKGQIKGGGRDESWNSKGVMLGDISEAEMRVMSVCNGTE